MHGKAPHTRTIDSEVDIESITSSHLILILHKLHVAATPVHVMYMYMHVYVHMHVQVHVQVSMWLHVKLHDMNYQLSIAQGTSTRCPCLVLKDTCELPNCTDMSITIKKAYNIAWLTSYNTAYTAYTVITKCIFYVQWHCNHGHNWCCACVGLW